MTLPWFIVDLPVLSLLAYVPKVCWLDVKNREVEHTWWIPLWVVNLPVLAYMYRIGAYPAVSLGISVTMIGLFYWLVLTKWMEGADFLWLAAISLFFVINPWPVPHGLMQFPFLIFLVAALLATRMILAGWNLRQGNQWNAPYPRGVPMMLPISAALVMTVVMG